MAVKEGVGEKKPVKFRRKIKPYPTDSGSIYLPGGLTRTQGSETLYRTNYRGRFATGENGILQKGVAKLECFAWEMVCQEVNECGQLMQEYEKKKKKTGKKRNSSHRSGMGTSLTAHTT